MTNEDLEKAILAQGESIKGLLAKMELTKAPEDLGPIRIQIEEHRKILEDLKKHLSAAHSLNHTCTWCD